MISFPALNVIILILLIHFYPTSSLKSVLRNFQQQFSWSSIPKFPATTLRSHSIFITTTDDTTNTNYENEHHLKNEIKSIIRNGPIQEEERVYLINGWRWHTLSVIRDLKRLIAVLRSVSSSNSLDPSKKKEQESEIVANLVKIQKGYQFVYKFNWNALISVERRVFFPWLEAVLPSVAKSYVKKISGIHDKIELLGERVGAKCSLMEREKMISMEVTEEIIHNLEQMIGYASQIKEIQDEVLVPLISSHISRKEQERFNRKVINGLGLINAQVHLVSMFEVVKDIPDESLAFQRQIPKIAQYTIPYWKKYFYDPKANALEL